MKQVYEDYLFSQGYFVGTLASESEGMETREDETPAISSHPAEALIALAHFAEIRITEHPELANLHMLEVAARNLGKDVPEPFMRGFPESALKLTSEQLLIDQLINYFITYDLGDMSQRRHSLLEEFYGRSAFAENVEPKLFAIVTPEKAEQLLARAVDGFLASSRPLSDASFAVLVQYLRDNDRLPSACASKDTACRLILEMREARFADLLVLPDIIRLVEWMIELGYPDSGMTLKKLSLKNRDRKLVTAVIDRQFERGGCDIATCLEKKRAWNGLLHHIHYRPRCPEAQTLCNAVRGHVARSAYSEFEQRMSALDVRGATDALLASKGPVAVLRNLNYLLSRCASDADIDYVLNSVETRNKIVLAQLLTHFYANARSERTFKFVRLNKMNVFNESQEAAKKRKSVLANEIALKASLRMESLLKGACHGTLGKVYVDGSLRNIALPLQEAASMGGFGTLPQGSRLPVPADKKLRAFIYWEKVDDIDLSCFALDDQGQMTEFSWRTMADSQSESLTFSGDVTSGYDGASEYFDVDLSLFKRANADKRLIVFSANVFTPDVKFSECICRAGYMLRDLDDSGEVFEPKTVKSSFAINCNSAAAHLFALDLKENAIVWLNLAENSMRRIAGDADMTFLLEYTDATDAINLRDFAQMLATEVVDAPEDADVVFSDEVLDLRADQEQIRSTDTARIVELLNA